MPDTVLAVLDGDGRPRLVHPRAALLRADDLGVLRGESAFETVRIAAGRPAFLDAHLVRLQRSAERLAITLPAGWRELAGLVAESYGRRDGVLRLVCSKGAPDDGPVGFALATPIPADTLAAREHGVRVVTLTLGIAAELRASAPWLLGGVKSTSYAVNMASVRHAQGEGADDAIWVRSDGEVLEAPTATVAWVRGGRLVTPPSDGVGVLAGTTLQVALSRCPVPAEVRRGTVDELREADEVMLLSSIRGVAPVTSIDGLAKEIGPVTAELRAAVEEQLAGEGVSPRSAPGAPG